LDRLERFSPSALCLGPQAELARRFGYPRAHTGHLLADLRLGVPRDGNLSAEHMQNRPLAPMETIADIKVERPVAVQLGPRRDIDGDPRLCVAVDPRGKAVRALPLNDGVNRRRAIQAIAPARKCHRAGAVNMAPDVAIGIDSEEQHAPMHAIHPLVDGGKSSWDFALDLGG
jgi:hypothetical protein